MTDLEKIKKIIEAYNHRPKKCPYCLKRLRTKFYKLDNSVRYYCSICRQFIDLEWDYMHAIAIQAKNYLVLNDPTRLYNLKKNKKK